MPRLRTIILRRRAANAYRLRRLLRLLIRRCLVLLAHRGVLLPPIGTQSCVVIICVSLQCRYAFAAGR